MPAIVGGQVRNWDAQRGLFVLAFDNGSVEPAYLPQPSVKIVNARGTVLDWESFFNYCRSVGCECYASSSNPSHLDAASALFADHCATRRSHLISAVPLTATTTTMQAVPR